MTSELHIILQEIMNEKGLNIAEVSRLCGLPDSTVRGIITRKQKSTALEVAFKLSKGLNVTLERLNGEVPSKNNNQIQHSTDTNQVLFAYENADFETKNNVRFLLKLPLLKEEMAEELCPSSVPTLTAEDERELELIKQEMLAEKKGITSTASISAKDA